jgi:hypothetical protein
VRSGFSWRIAFFVLLAAACTGAPSVTGPAPGFDSVTGKDWLLVELRGGPGFFSRDRLNPEFTDAYSLRFVLSTDQASGGMASGRGAPNLYRFPFETGQDQSLGIKPGAATLMAPIIQGLWETSEPEGLREEEYFGYLERASRWNLRDGDLEIFTRTEKGEEAVLVYRPLS